MEELTVIVEKTNTGYSCYAIQINGIIGVGNDIDETQLSFLECLSHHVDYEIETKGAKGVRGYDVKWVFELSDYDAQLNGIRDICYNASLLAGWHTDINTGELKERNKAEMICLIHSELSEAMEGERKNLMDDHLHNRPMAEVEMADAVIRIMDYCGRWGYDIGGAVMEKLEYNANRADHKIENRIKENGKQF